jgi:hypothetical protein
MKKASPRRRSDHRKIDRFAQALSEGATPLAAARLIRPDAVQTHAQDYMKRLRADLGWQAQ